MFFYSTRNKNIHISFKEAVLNGLAEDGGLYMPHNIPKLDTLFLRQLPMYSFEEIAFEVSKLWVENEVSEKELKNLVKEAFDFSVPLRLTEKGIGFLELFHGPTLAFKDFGARYMARLMSLFVRNSSGPLHILVATSGDTGGAVADGFANVPGIQVTILYPEGKVSPFQEFQIANPAKNIQAIAVNGTFDHCQELVKKAFLDKEIRNKLFITSANSINIARLLPQTFYFIYAYAQLMGQGIREVSFTVPSGNFGNLGAGLLAKKMGLPIHSLVAGTNKNDTVPRYLNSGKWELFPTQSTLSNAMDVNNPSNWDRILDLFEGDLGKLKENIYGYSFSDEETLNAMEYLKNSSDYSVCPHTAIGWLAANKFREKFPGAYAQIILSTAHPGKFQEMIPDSHASLKNAMVLPASISNWQGEKIQKIKMENSFDQLKMHLLK